MKAFLVSLLLVICFSPLNTFGGECIDGDCLNGWGTYTYPNSGRYQGEWKDGRFHGQGIYCFPDGGKYIGQMRDGERDGQGVMYYSDGGKYVGHWRYGDMDGYGTYTYPDGSKDDGRWKNGKYHGRGNYVYNDKDARFKYVGLSNYVKKHGYWTGIMSYKNACKYERLILQASKQFGVDCSLIRAIIKTESDFDSWAVSRKGAQGLMQLMPQTAKSMAVDDPFNPEENILGGTRYFSLLLKRFKNNKTLALAAYNAGPDKVEAYQGVPPFAETRTYVKRVMEYYQLYNGGSY
jgi:soluble lytic murein transglycosylase